MRTIFAEYNPHRNSIDVYTSAGYICSALTREFDTLKSKKVLQSLETGLFFCQIFIFSI